MNKPIRGAAQQIASVATNQAAEWIKSLRKNLSQSLFRYHVVPGLDHPEEETVNETLEGHGEDAAVLFAAIVMSGESWRGDLLRLLAHAPEHLTRSWGIPLAGTALNDPDMDVREAAISALEIWGGAEAKCKLVSHQDPAQWLTEFAHRVAREME